MEPNSKITLVLEALGRTDVVELSELLEISLNSTIDLVKNLQENGIVTMDKFGHVVYKAEKKTVLKITGQNLSKTYDEVMCFISTFEPGKFPRQRRLTQNQIDGIMTEWDLVQKLMQEENDFICRWEPFGSVRDIEISFKSGEKLLFVQVKSTKSDRISLSESDSERLSKQYGKNGYFAFRLGNLPFYFVPCEELRAKEIHTVDVQTLVSRLSTHYDVSTFKQGIKKCLIPSE